MTTDRGARKEEALVGKSTVAASPTRMLAEVAGKRSWNAT